MKTRNLLKLFFTGLAVILFSNIYAQPYQPFPDMTATQADGTDSVTVGTEMVYYVEPDATINNLSMQYDTSWTQTEADNNGVYSTFDFFWGTQVGSIYTPSPSGDGSDTWNAPYRRIHFTSEGSGRLDVQEIGPDPANCAGTVRQLDIEVIGQPTFTIGGGTVNEICASTGAAGVDVTISGITVDTDGSYLEIPVDVTVETDDGSGTYSTEIRSLSDSLISVEDPIGSAPSTTLISNYWMGAQSGNITRYTFDFGSSADAGSNGINDYVSRKSDYFESGPTYYAAQDAEADRVLTWIVYPQPETGNIYYVPNDFDQ